jgi:hypothetical protein
MVSVISGHHCPEICVLGGIRTGWPDTTNQRPKPSKKFVSHVLDGENAIIWLNPWYISVKSCSQVVHKLWFELKWWFW